MPGVFERAFDTFIKFRNHEQLLGGKWSTRGYKCRGMLGFTVFENVNNAHLDRCDLVVDMVLISVEL
jgi:hypothetical protein